jgi:hypothetical protein
VLADVEVEVHRDLVELEIARKVFCGTEDAVAVDVLVGKNA